MKKLFKYYLILSIITGLVSCDEPILTELDPNETDDFEIELQNSDPDNVVFTGYDSTGVVIIAPRFSTLISASGIKNSYKGITVKKTFYQAVFFDKNRPVKNRHGRTIGFKTRTLGRVTFDNDSAWVLPLKIRFKENGILEDTTLGFQHVLFSLPNHPFIFPYSSMVDIKFHPFMGQSTQFSLPTPAEITGQVKINGRRDINNLRMELTWNGVKRDRIAIIFGGIVKGRDITLPLYKLSTFDDGRLVIPPDLINSIPFDHFDNIVISFIRRYKFNHQQQDNFIVSHSIHNIKLDIP